MPTFKIPDGLTVRVTTNARQKTTKILAYRKGGFKRAYKAILPMCDDELCRTRNVHSEFVRKHLYEERVHTFYHPRNVDVFIAKLIKSYR